MADQELPKLTPKQRLFVEYYCGADDGVAFLNATQAYIKAGYSPVKAHTNAANLLRNTTIRAHIEDLFAEKALSRNISLALIADDASISDDEILARSSRFKSELTASSFVSGKMSARTTARTNLLKAHGVFTENLNVTGGIDIQIVGVDTEKL